MLYPEILEGEIGQAGFNCVPAPRVNKGAVEVSGCVVLVNLEYSSCITHLSEGVAVPSNL